MTDDVEKLPFMYDMTKPIYGVMHQSASGKRIYVMLDCDADVIETLPTFNW
jgi:hypothetical protein